MQDKSARAADGASLESVSAVSESKWIRAALAYVEDWDGPGWKVLPLTGKVPITEHGVKDATGNKATIRQWWGQWPDANIGVAVPNGYVVFDVDPRHGGTLEALGEIPETIIQRSGGGGWHVWFKLTLIADGGTDDDGEPTGDYPELRGKCGLAGVDVRKVGNYVVVQPSVHESGQRYKWQDGCDPRKDPYPRPAEIPPHLLERIVKPKKVARSVPSTPRTPMPASATSDSSTWLERAIERVRQGAVRNETGFWLATQLRDDGLDMDAAETIMLQYAEAVSPLGDHPYEEQEALNSLGSAYSQPARERATTEIPPQLGAARGTVIQAGVSVQSNSANTAGDGASVVAQAKSAKLQASTSLQGEGEDFILFSSLRFDSIRLKLTASGFVGLGERYPDLLSAMQAVDAMPEEGPVQHPTPARERRRRQYNVLTAVWSLAFPDDMLSQNQMSTWLNLAAKTEPGMEGELVLDAIVSYLCSPHNGAIRSPKVVIDAAIRNALDPDGQAERKAKRAASRAEYKMAKKADDGPPAKVNKVKPAQPNNPAVNPKTGEWRDPNAPNVLAGMRKRAPESGKQEDHELAERYARTRGLA
jgi:hypothetical protein